MGTIEYLIWLIAEKHLAGKHDQKRHAWRYGGGMAGIKRSLEGRSRGEREEYKRRARERGQGGGVEVSDKRVDRAKAKVKAELDKLHAAEQPFRKMDAEYRKRQRALQRITDKRGVLSQKLAKAQKDVDVYAEERNRLMDLGQDVDPFVLEKFDKAIAARNKYSDEYWKLDAKQMEAVDSVNKFAKDNNYPTDAFGTPVAHYPREKIGQLRKEFHRATKESREVVFQDNLRKAEQVRKDIINLPKKNKREIARLSTEERKLDVERASVLKEYNKTLTKTEGVLDTIPGTEQKQLELTDRLIQLDQRRMELSGNIRELNKPTMAQYAMLNVDNPAKVDYKQYVKGADSWQPDDWKAGQERFNQWVGTGTLDGVEVQVKPITKSTGFEDRSFHTYGHKGVNSTTYMDSTSGKGVMIHELGHALEAHDRFVADKAKKFLERRTKTDVTKSLKEVTKNPSYSEDEVTKRDDFFSPYVGKQYASGSTEIMSMGLEHMNRTPEGFAEQDPDFFRFVYAASRS